MPHAFVLELVSPEGRNPLHPGLYAHGLFFALLKKLDPNLASKVHAAQRKPFTLAAFNHKHSLHLRFTTLNDELFAPLLKTLLHESVGGLRLGDQSLVLQRVLATPQGHRLAGQQTWAQLCNQPALRQMHLRFLSPTVFTTSKADKRTRHTPLPDPLLVIKSLLRSWQIHSPWAYSELNAAALQSVFELDLELVGFSELSCQKTFAGKAQYSGFVGDARFHLHSDSIEVQQALGRLSAYAFYSGVGAKTTYGLGCCHTPP